MKLIIGLIIAMSGASAHASSLFYDKCDQQASLLMGDNPEMILVATNSGFAGMSCQDLKSTFEAAQLVGIVLMPATLALKTPGVREGVVTELAALGLTFSNPAVLGVTVIGAVGVVTVYLVMKSSLDECERQNRDQLKQEILREIKQSYPGSNGSNVPLEIRKDGRAA